MTKPPHFVRRLVHAIRDVQAVTNLSHNQAEALVRSWERLELEWNEEIAKLAAAANEAEDAEKAALRGVAAGTE